MKLRHYVLIISIVGIWIYKMLILPVKVYPQAAFDAEGNILGGEAFVDYGASAQIAVVYTFITLALWFLFYMVLPKVLKR